MSLVHVVSVSSGKDSTALLLLALERFPRETVVPIFCDTANEDAQVYTYLDYLEEALGVKIHRLKADFSQEIAAKRMFLARDVRTRREYSRVPKVDREGNPVWLRDKAGAICMFPVVDEDGDPTGEVAPRQKMGWNAGRRVRWSNKAKRRALAVLHPTGNAYLDLCLWKGRFPSRKAQFCTEHLKRNIAVEFQLALIDQGHTVISWQGVRRDESQARANAKLIERIGPNLRAYRPLVEWTAGQVLRYATARGIAHNPLYRQGMSRVGCMPCINAQKAELREIADRFPDHIDRIAEWELIVGRASKRGFSTFFTDSHDAVDRRETFAEFKILTRVEWSRTTRGGKQFDLFEVLRDPRACASAYGLCE